MKCIFLCSLVKSASKLFCLLSGIMAVLLYFKKALLLVLHFLTASGFGNDLRQANSFWASC